MEILTNTKKNNQHKTLCKLAAKADTLIIAWEGIEEVHLVEEWRGDDNKMIPREWLE